jgi:hypothetical protein
VHRDVKPANVLLTAALSDAPSDALSDALPGGGLPDGAQAAKLTDFGVARVIEGDRMTMHGLAVGTANYLSPEQATGGEVGPATDVYALGLVLLECLTGAVAFPGSGAVTAAARLYQPVPIPPALDGSWRDLLAAMTDADPARRPSATQVASTLTRFTRGDESVSDRVTALLPPVAPAAVGAGATRMAATMAAGRSRRGRTWALGGLSAAAAGIAAIWIALAAAPSTSSGLPSTGGTTPAAPTAVPTAVATPVPTSTGPVAVRATPPHHPAPPPPQAPDPHPPKHGKKPGGDG